MHRVTVPPVGANNLHTSLSMNLLPYNSALCIIAWAFPQCKTNQPTTKETGTQGPCVKDTAQGLESVHLPGESCWL